MGKEKNPVTDNFFEEGLHRLGLCQSRISSLLGRYIEEIELFNPAYKLVKVKDRRELIVKHIFDSLAPLETLRGLSNETGKIADIGSGAGLPGIPLAICMDGVEFTLVERMGRRAGFLRDTIAVLGLSNVRVEEAEMEKLWHSSKERFNLIVFRAFKPLEARLLKRLLRLLGPGGILAAYKGRRQRIEEEMSVIQWKQAPWEIIPVEVPFLHEERHLVVIRN